MAGRDGDFQEERDFAAGQPPELSAALPRHPRTAAANVHRRAAAQRHRDSAALRDVARGAPRPRAGASDPEEENLADARPDAPPLAPRGLRHTLQLQPGSRAAPWRRIQRLQPRPGVVHGVRRAAQGVRRAAQGASGAAQRAPASSANLERTPPTRARVAHTTSCARPLAAARSRRRRFFAGRGSRRISQQRRDVRLRAVPRIADGGPGLWMSFELRTRVARRYDMMCRCGLCGGGVRLMKS